MSDVKTRVVLDRHTFPLFINRQESARVSVPGALNRRKGSL